MISKLINFFTPVETFAPSDLVKCLENDRIEREIALQEAIMDRKNAYNLAVARERYAWLLSCGILTSFISVVSAFTHKNILHTLPIPPIITGILYETHACYGNKNKVLRNLADKIFEDKNILPQFCEIHIDEIDARIQKNEENF